MLLLAAVLAALVLPTHATITTPEFLGLAGAGKTVWKEFGGPGTCDGVLNGAGAGEGMMVGVIDTGEHAPCFFPVPSIPCPL